MAHNSSNATHPPPPSPSGSIFDFLDACFNSTVGAFNITAFTIFSILLLLPLFILVFFVGYRKRQQQGPDKGMSHSDLFTYNMIIIELMNILGSILCCCSYYANLPEALTVGIFLLPINLTGQIMFHILMCLERYMAVIHPVAYLSLKRTNGIRMRNSTIVCAWLFSLSGIGRLFLTTRLSISIVCYLYSVTSILIISFCSVSVLCALIRPRPGEGGGDGKRLSQSKLRAFCTITAILGVLLFRCAGVIIVNGLYDSPQLNEDERCGMWISIVWICVPSSSVLPLLFLLRAGKLACYKKDNN